MHNVMYMMEINSSAASKSLTHLIDCVNFAFCFIVIEDNVRFSHFLVNSIVFPMHTR